MDQSVYSYHEDIRFHYGLYSMRVQSPDHKSPARHEYVDDPAVTGSSCLVSDTK